VYIWRLLNDPKYRDLGFPRPLKVNTWKFWRRVEIRDWIRNRTEVSKKADGAELARTP